MPHIQRVYVCMYVCVWSIISPQSQKDRGEWMWRMAGQKRALVSFRRFSASFFAHESKLQREKKEEKKEEERVINEFQGRWRERGELTRCLGGSAWQLKRAQCCPTCQHKRESPNLQAHTSHQAATSGIMIRIRDELNEKLKIENWKWKIENTYPQVEEKSSRLLSIFVCCMSMSIMSMPMFCVWVCMCVSSWVSTMICSLSASCLNHLRAPQKQSSSK